jgi:hypothetical protein
MTSNILDLFHQRQMEIKMAKAKLNQPVREVANIVWQYNGCDTTQVVRYTDMKAAEKDYNKLLEAADHGRPLVLTGPSMTCAIRFPQNIVHCYLIVVDDNNFLQADTQKRFQAMMQ